MDVLAECRKNFGPPGRKFSFWENLTYLRITKPAMLPGGDELALFFRHQGRVRRDGIIVWGHIIQANQRLFSRGWFNCPGEVVYVANERIDVRPSELAEIASRLAELRETESRDPQLLAIGRYLANERIRVFGREVPLHFSHNIPCAISTVFFARHYLPGRVLSRPLMPILVMPSQPRIAMTLPSRYWPQEFVDWWIQAG